MRAYIFPLVLASSVLLLALRSLARALSLSLALALFLPCLSHHGIAASPRVLRASHPHNTTPWCCIDPSQRRLRAPSTAPETSALCDATRRDALRRAAGLLEQRRKREMLRESRSFPCRFFVSPAAAALATRTVSFPSRRVACIRPGKERREGGLCNFGLWNFPSLYQFTRDVNVGISPTRGGSNRATIFRRPELISSAELAPASRLSMMI